MPTRPGAPVSVVAAIAVWLAGMGSAAAQSDATVAIAPGAAPRTAITQRGTDQFIGRGNGRVQQIAGGPVTLDLAGVPIAVAAKAVLADTLGWSYSLDERVNGTVTLQTGGPVSRQRLLEMFSAVVTSQGAVMRRRGTAVQIVPAGGAPAVTPVRSLPGQPGEGGAIAVPLRWIAAAEMQSILSAVAPRDVVLRVDRARNLLILSGDATQIDALRDTIAVFDVDWMRGMSTAMVPVQNANPGTVARSLAEIFGPEAAGEGAVIRFVPNDSLGAVLVITSRAAYLDRARSWIARLDGLAGERERQLFVYRIQNRPAKELAAVLQGVVQTEMGDGGGSSGGALASRDMSGGMAGSGVGAGLGSGLSGGFGGAGLDNGGFGGGLGSGSAAGGGGAMADQPGALGGAAAASLPGGGFGGGGTAGWGGTGGGASGFGGGNARAGSAAGYGGETGAAYGMAAGGGRRDGGVGIVADEADNSLVISATRSQYDRILRILAQLDAMPTQVLLETVIAEVTLNDQLSFGVQWFLKNGGSRFNLAQNDTVEAAPTSGTAGLVAAAARGVPGFNYLLSGADFNVVLNALRGITRVHVLSSPNLTVLDNRTARLQIGDQVPIVRQSGQSALAAGAPVLNEIELKDTGVILAVTPRVNKNGLVVLDINQEVSDVVPTTTSAINSPTIRQRRVATSVAVRDGHSLAIGGLVQEKAEVVNSAVPLLGDLPLVGAAFRNRSDTRTRTELIVFIRPKVMRGTADADEVSDDFRRRLKVMMPVRPVPPPPLRRLESGPLGLRNRILD